MGANPTQAWGVTAFLLGFTPRCPVVCTRGKSVCASLRYCC